MWKLTEWSGPSPARCAAGLAYQYTTCKNIVTLRAAGLAYQHTACKNISRHSPCMSHALTRPSHQMAQGRIADKLDDFWAGRDSTHLQSGAVQSQTQSCLHVEVIVTQAPAPWPCPSRVQTVQTRSDCPRVEPVYFLHASYKVAHTAMYAITQQTDRYATVLAHRFGQICL